MNSNYLDFEQPIAELQAKIDELKNVGSDNAINLDEEIQRLQSKMRQKIESIFKDLTPWQISQLSRHPLRPYTLDYIERSREQSDTGDETELSADDYVFDNTDERGRDMEVTQESTLEAAAIEHACQRILPRNRLDVPLTCLAVGNVNECRGKVLSDRLADHPQPAPRRR